MKYILIVVIFNTTSLSGADGLRVTNTVLDNKETCEYVAAETRKAIAELRSSGKVNIKCVEAK